MLDIRRDRLLIRFTILVVVQQPYSHGGLRRPLAATQPVNKLTSATIKPLQSAQCGMVDGGWWLSRCAGKPGSSLMKNEGWQADERAEPVVAAEQLVFKPDGSLGYPPSAVFGHTTNPERLHRYILICPVSHTWRDCAFTVHILDLKPPPLPLFSSQFSKFLKSACRHFPHFPPPLLPLQISILFAHSHAKIRAKACC